MKLARWGVALEFATVNAPVWGEVTAHVFVDDSRAPVCQPHVAGEPVDLYDNHGARHCGACHDLLGTALWSSTSFARRRLCVARYVPPNPSTTQIGSGLDHPLEIVADTDAEAFGGIIAALDRIVPKGAPTRIIKVGEADALKVARERRAEARQLRVSDDTGAQVVELVYRHHKRYRAWLSHDFDWETETAKVLRRTTKKLFVEDKRGSYTTDGGVLVLKTYALDRAALEKGVHRWGWTLNPHPPASGSSSVPGWAEVLGVEIPCTLAQAKRAFRTAAKTAHPDNGGSDVAFRRVKAAFDAASQHLGGAS